jgi:hypothetical protein
VDVVRNEARPFTRAFITIGCVFAAALALAACSPEAEPPAAPEPTPGGCADAAPDESAAVASVDGHPVTAAELAAYADANAFPIGTEAEARTALDALIRFKAAQVEAFERGLTSAVEYGDLLRGLACGNGEREAAIAEGRAVYGVAEHDAETYLAYTESSVRDALLNALAAEGALGPTEDELADFYERSKDEYARGQDAIGLQVLRFETSAAGSAAADDVLARTAAGEPWAEVAADHAADAALLDAHPLAIDDANAYDLSKYQSSLFIAADALAVGETALVTDDLAGGLLVLHCERRDDGGFLPLDEVRPELVLRFQDEAFELHLDGLVADAGIETADAILPLLG